MRIGVVGCGVVGQAVARSYLEYVDEVRCYDLMRERSPNKLIDVLDCDIIFVCLPTPARHGGLDVSAIHAFFANQEGSTANFVLRSTVPIGTTRQLVERYRLPNLVHSPEFLTARCALIDACMPARNIVGVPGFTGVARHPYPGETLCELMESRFPGAPTMVMSSDESEAVKLFLNGFFAVKVAYFNEVNELARKLGLDWGRVMAALLADGRVSPYHTRVPGPDGKYGFGGECLVKDAGCLAGMIEMSGLDPAVVRVALVRNIRDREKDV